MSNATNTNNSSNQNKENPKNNLIGFIFVLFIIIILLMGGSLFEFDTTSIFTWIIIGVFFVIGVFSNQKKRNQTANSTSADSRPVYNQDNTPKVVPEEIIRPMAPKESFESSFSLTCPYCGTLITKKRDTCPKCKNII